MPGDILFIVNPFVDLNTGNKIPLMGFGTCKIFDEMKTAVDAALTNGYRLFDTARAYDNEHFLGQALVDLLPAHNLKREDVFLETKILIAESNVADNVRKDVMDSLKNLGTNYIDIVLIHYPKHNETPNESPKNAEMRREAYLALEQLKREGLIRSVGVSNYEISHLEEISAYGDSLPALNQIELHPHFVRKELVDYCKKNGIVVQAFSSLARQTPSLMEHPLLNTLAEKYKCSTQNILLSWATSQGFPVIPKSANPKRIVENTRALSIVLSPEEISALSQLDQGQNYVGRCTGWLVL